jgi:hypothetical protein
MSFLDRLLGRQPAPPRTSQPRSASDPDAMAVERYRYLLRTAPPDQLEQAHAEAFAKLTPQQRSTVLADLVAVVPPGEMPSTTDPAAMARAATRAEARQPGTLERAFQGSPAGPGLGGSFLQTFAAVFVATTVAQALFGGLGDPFGPDASGTDGDAGAGGDAGIDADGGGDVGGDFGGYGDFGGGDF